MAEKEWLTVREWNDREGRDMRATVKAVSAGKIPHKLFRESEVIPGSKRRKLVAMISSETTGRISSDFSRRKNPIYTKAGQRKMIAARKKNERERAKERRLRERKLLEASKDLDPMPFLGWILSRPESQLQLAQKAGYADDRAIIRLWTDEADTVRSEYVQRVLEAHGRKLKDVYKDLD